MKVIHFKPLSFRLTNGRRKGLANRSVVLDRRIKIKKKWAYRKVSEELIALALGEYYVSWYEGSRKRLDPVGSDPEAALAELSKKRLEFAYIAAGGAIKENNNLPGDNGRRKRVSTEVKENLADCLDRQGKSGYGLAVRILRATSTVSAFWLNSGLRPTWTRSMRNSSRVFAGSFVNTRRTSETVPATTSCRL